MTYSDFKSIMRDFNDSDLSRKGKLVGRVVIDQKSFTQEYSLESRTYETNNDNKAFKFGMGGYSIFASALDGTDNCIRLEHYIEGSDHPWDVEDCYFVIGDESIYDPNKVRELVSLSQEDY